MVETVLRVGLRAAVAVTVLGTAAISALQSPAADALRATLLERAADGDCVPIIPDLEAMHNAQPGDTAVTASLSQCLIAHAAMLPTEAARQAERARARQLAVEAWDKGDRGTLLRSIIDYVPPDGDTGEHIVTDPAERQRFIEGEAAFARRDYVAAAAAYRAVLAAEPGSYLAALMLGDVGFATGQHEEAARWFSLAIEIDPDIETAYRYWADDLMKQGRPEDARDKYIDAFIADPYDRLTQQSLESWARSTNHLLTQPPIVAWHVEDLNPDRLDDTGLRAWAQYQDERAAWKDHKYRAAFPDSTKYRRSLSEERASLERVVADVRTRQSQGTVRTLDGNLKTLVRLADEGLLDAFILFTVPDVVADYAAYRKDHRDELRRYVLEWMVQARTPALPPPSGTPSGDG